VVHYEPRIRRMLYSLTQDSQFDTGSVSGDLPGGPTARCRGCGGRVAFCPLALSHCAQSVAQRMAQAQTRHLGTIFPPQGYGDDTFDEPGEDYLESPEHFEEQVGQRDLIQRVLARLPEASGGLPSYWTRRGSPIGDRRSVAGFFSRRCAVVSHVLVRPSNSSTPSLNRRDVDEVL